MNRREFLTLGGVLSTAAIVAFSPIGRRLRRSVEARIGDQRFMGMVDGKFYVSSNAGKSWQLHTDFGSDFSIAALSANASGNLHAQLGFKGHSFELTLAPNGSTWRTV